MSPLAAMWRHSGHTDSPGIRRRLLVTVNSLIRFPLCRLDLGRPGGYYRLPGGILPFRPGGGM